MLALAPLLLACSGSPKPTAPAGEAPSEAQPAETPPPDAPAEGPQAEPSSAGLTDVTQGIDKGGCDNGPGNEGARAYFAGEYTRSGPRIKGTERWLVFANEKLMKAPHWDGKSECEVKWRVDGTIVGTGSCGDCDFGIKATAKVDTSATSCTEDLWKKEREMELLYDVDLLSDGTAILYFSKSGKRVGEGYSKGDSFNFITDPKCQWF